MPCLQNEKLHACQNLKSYDFENKKDLNTGNLCYDYVGTTKYKMSARPTKDIVQINQNQDDDEKIEIKVPES